jgi:hypothetical protein
MLSAYYKHKLPHSPVEYSFLETPKMFQEDFLAVQNSTDFKPYFLLISKTSTFLQSKKKQFYLSLPYLH